VAGVSVGAAAMVSLDARRAPGTVDSPGIGSSAHAAASMAALVPLSPPSTALSADVAVTVESNASGSSVWLGAKRVGDAPGPLTLPRGSTEVMLTVKADGYVPSTVTVVPVEDVVVAVKLVRAVATPASGSRRVSKDLENPF